jgi:hypothetical protein
MAVQSSGSRADDALRCANAFYDYYLLAREPSA